MNRQSWSPGAQNKLVERLTSPVVRPKSMTPMLIQSVSEKSAATKNTPEMNNLSARMKAAPRTANFAGGRPKWQMTMSKGSRKISVHGRSLSKPILTMYNGTSTVFKQFAVSKIHSTRKPPLQAYSAALMTAIQASPMEDHAWYHWKNLLPTVQKAALHNDNTATRKTVRRCVGPYCSSMNWRSRPRKRQQLRWFLRGWRASIFECRMHCVLNTAMNPEPMNTLLIAW
mmetsp:Transcript_78639/g.240631  ORF Transcript_78639/g.240631 Transcript_78639/m.240631 type:complete len:228 (-) Transcript_78639:459-1142(-)